MSDKGMSAFKKNLWITLPALLIALLPEAAWAHTEEDGAGLVSGLLHPILGYDHLLAMLSVGIVSAQLGGRQIWAVPTFFVLSMLAGGIIGFNQIELTHVELGIALSVLVLGLAILAVHYRLQGRYGVYLIMAMVIYFGIMHGHAHGMEMPNSASPVFYSLGFILSTSSIHLVGVAIGHTFTHTASFRRATSLIGTAMTLAGCFILYGV